LRDWKGRRNLMIGKARGREGWWGVDDGWGDLTT